MAAKRLGRGLDFLINEDAKFEGDEILELEIDSLVPNRLQPRQVFDETQLQELADSIEEHGVLQPVVVRPTQGGYELIAGERRSRACQLLGRDTIPAVVRDVGDEQLLELALIENLHRSDLNPIEKAEACRRLIDRFQLSHADAAKKLGKSRSTLSNLLRLLDLPEAARRHLAEGALTTGHAKVLLGCADADRREVLAERVVRDGLSVRELERLTSEPRGDRPAPKEVPAKPAYILDLESRLRDGLGTKVTIHEKNERGRIVIEFFSQDDFERLFALLERARG